jgi:ribosomal-protein-alanine N-acetyltransferase
VTTAVLREMRWWDIEPVLELEKDLFPEDAWSRGMFWSDLAHARGPGATRRYVVAEIAFESAFESDSGSGSGSGAKGGARIVGYGGLAAAGDVGDVQTIA